MNHEFSNVQTIKKIFWYVKLNCWIMRHNKCDWITNKLARKLAITLRNCCKYPISVFLLLLPPPPPPIISLLISSLLLMSHSPSEKRCRQTVASCWWEPCRTHSGTSGWAGCAESCRPETWSHRCCRQNTCRPPETGWQICPVAGDTDCRTGLTETNQTDEC